MPEKISPQWATRTGVILAVAGSAVGLGNFLRFPGNAASNGGGAFMIPYICALVFLGIPTAWVEWTVGRFAGQRGFHSAPAVMGLIGRGSLARYLGSIGVLIPVAVYFYYVIIESWCLSYFWHYAAHGGIGVSSAQTVAEQVAASRSFFNDFIGIAQDGVSFGKGLTQQFTFWLLVTAVNVFLIYRGLAKGIEKFCNLAVPAMVICGLFVLVRVLTLGTPDATHPDQNVLNGLGFMWNPRFDRLGDFQAWLAAAGQIFFSLSVGFGIIINYASYLPPKADVTLSGLTAAATNEFFEVGLGGTITLTAAVVFLGTQVTGEAAGSTFSLGFATLPVVFAHMPAGQLFGAIWFFMLFLAAITSSLSMLQPAKAFLEEALGLAENKATIAVTAVCLLGNLFVLWFSGGLKALDTFDFWIGSFMIFIMASTQIIAFGWGFGIDRGWQEAHRSANLRIPSLYRPIIKYLSPAYLIAVFVGFCWQQLPGYVRSVLGSGDAPGDTTVQLTWAVIAALLIAIIVITAIGVRRWRRAGLDIDGQRA